jgi:hypothetical protein
MNNEEKNLLIAKNVFGYKSKLIPGTGVMGILIPGVGVKPCPDYVHDLNACNEFECYFQEHQLMEFYLIFLICILFPKEEALNNLRFRTKQALRKINPNWPELITAQWWYGVVTAKPNFRCEAALLLASKLHEL